MADHEHTADPETSELALWQDEHGLVVAGDSSTVAAVVSELTDWGIGTASRSPLSPADLAAVFSSGFADGATSSAAVPGSTSGEYFQLTERARRLVAEHGLFPSEGGAFRGFVTDTSGSAGHLDWMPVSGAERALVLQQTAIGFALRMAIAEVDAAVERVEGKVDSIVDDLRAQRLGHVLGDRRSLLRLAETARRTGALPSADWMAIASLGPAIERDLEMLRSSVRILLDGSTVATGPRGRVREAERILDDGHLAETLSLLTVAESNLHLWQELRVAQTRSNEPEHLATVTAGARDALDEHRAEDLELCTRLAAVRSALTDPRSLDGLAPMQSRRLEKAERRFEQIVEVFGAQRRFELEADGDGSRPGLPDSIAHVGTLVKVGLETASTVARARGARYLPKRLPGRGDGSAAAALEAGDERDADAGAEGEDGRTDDDGPAGQ